MENIQLTEQQCRSYLYQLRFPDGYRCPVCQNGRSYATKEGNYKCSGCGYKMSMKVGTVLEGSGLSLTQWFEAVRYAASQPYPGKVTISTYQKEANIGSNRSAAKVKRVIDQALARRPLDKLSGNVEVCLKTVLTAGPMMFLLLAGEIENRKVLRYRGMLFADRPTELSLFLETCVATGSRIHFPNGLGELRLAEAGGYVWVKHTEAFCARMIEAESYTFISALRFCKEITEAQKKTDEICQERNGAYMPIMFEELLKRVIDLPSGHKKSKRPE